MNVQRHPRFGTIALVLLGAGATYLLVVLPGILAGVLATFIPCDGFLCEIGNGVLGALFGAVVGLAAAFVVTRRMGLRWWFIPVLVGVVVLGAAVSASFDTVAPQIGLLLVVASPVIAAVTAAGLQPAVMGRAAVALVVAFAVILGLLALGDQLDRRSRLSQRAENFRTTSLPLYAPTALDDVELKLIRADQDHVMYDINSPDHDGWLRVMLESSAAGGCHVGNAEDVGDGIYVSPGPKARRVCRDLDGMTAELWPDGAASSWPSDAMVHVARSLEPADAQWFVDRQA